MSITLRPFDPDDEPFLFELYASTRDEEMALVDWDVDQKEAFLRMQCTAQLTHYQTYSPQARHDIIVLNDTPIGRIYVDRREDEIRLLDIALLPAYRSQGIGTALMRDLMDEGAQTGKPVTLNVEQPNLGARRFYERLRFAPVSTTGLHILMEWVPEG
jgi:ribosomal protein S18 acetylase RimI-like enzyme